ncbi:MULTISPECIES: hypothetical protein [unclassified Micromonospora]
MRLIEALPDVDVALRVDDTRWAEIDTPNSRRGVAPRTAHSWEPGTGF